MARRTSLPMYQPRVKILSNVFRVVVIASFLWIFRAHLHFLARNSSHHSDERKATKLHEKHEAKRSSISNSSVPRGKSEIPDDYQCVIPFIPIWPEYFSKWNPPRFISNCAHEQTLAELRDTKISKLPSLNLTCCMQEIIRGSKDSKYNLTDCVPLNNEPVNISERESILINCDNFTNVFAHIPIKKGVMEKLIYWKGISDEERPLSVYILGIDTVSRSHAYRSLNQSIKLMKELDFLDFQAYHSVAPSTLTNLMAMLMGLARSEVRGACAKDWATPFDNCPLIWKNFSNNNYITGYVEDGDQSFNWGGQSGFVDQPTDYYLHHLFLALARSRQNVKKRFGKNKKYSSACTSEESVPEFLLKYNIRWLAKFSHVPFFFLSWFAYPFHDDIYALANFDMYLADLFKFLKTQINLLRKSLIIVVSDHGDRMSFFNSKSIESYFERGLPQLFIRLPDQLRENYPDIVEAFQSNSKKLTTPFDIHQTLLHVLSLNSKDLESKNFEPERKDRCSFFVDVPLNRTCASTKLPSTHCLCNTQYTKNTTEMSKISPEYATKLLSFSMAKLNEKVTKYNYSSICSTWTSNSSYIIYTRYISQTISYDETLIAFTAFPGRAEFEGRLKIRKGINNSDISTFTELVGFSRNNRFGDQSWCIPTVTDEDKEMKELCNCKARKP